MAADREQENIPAGTNKPADPYQKQGDKPTLDTVPTSDVPGSAGMPGTAPGGEEPVKVPKPVQKPKPLDIVDDRPDSEK